MVEQTKECRFCGGEIARSATVCEHCGMHFAREAREHEEPADPGEPTRYAEVPWYRRSSTAIVVWILFGPLVAIIAATGPIYYQRRGRLMKYSSQGRFFLVVLGVVWMVGVIVNVASLM